MKPTSTLLTALATVAISSAALAAPETHGINPADMDPAVQACQDFNIYASGGWLKANPIPADQSYWGSFTILEETNKANLHTVLEKVSKAANAPGTDDQKVGDFYATCMDEAAIEAQGITPLKGELAAIDKISNTRALQAEIARLQMMGVNAVFNFGSDQDRKERERGHRRRVPGRPRTARPRLLHEDRRGIEEDPRPVPRPSSRRCSASWATTPRRPRPTRRRSWPSRRDWPRPR